MNRARGPEPNRAHMPVWLAWLILASIYFGAAKFGLTMALPHPGVSPVWPPTGIALAALLLWGYRMWPGVLIGSFLTYLTLPEPWWTALGIGLGNTLEALAGAWLIQRLLAKAPFLGNPGRVILFGTIALLAGLVGATLGTLSLCASQAARWSDFWAMWGTWWLGDSVGVVVVAPLLISWTERYGTWFRRSAAELLLLLTLVLTIGQLVFSNWFPIVGHYPLSYLLLLPLLWTALDCQIRGATAAMTLVMAIAVWGTQQGFGPFVLASRGESILQLQLFLGLTTVTVLCVATFSWDRLQREKEYRSREKMLRAVVEHTPDAVFVRDVEGRSLMINPAAAKLLGRSADEARNKRYDELFGPDMARRLLQHDAQILATGTPRTEDFELSQPEGVRRFLTTMFPLPGPQAKPVGIIGIVRDITDFVSAERALRRSHALLLAEQEANPDGLLVVDEQRAVISFNRRFREMWQIPEDLMRTRDDQKLLGYVTSSLSDPEAFLAKVLYLYDHPQETGHDEIPLKDGRVFERNTAPANSPEGEYFGRFWFFRDITEHKQMERAIQDQFERLKQLDRLKDLFLSSISHEMKTPLSLIIGNTELLQDKYPDEEQIAGILDGSRRLTEHLNKILDYSALLSGSLPLYITEVCLAETARFVCEVVNSGSEFRLKGLKFELDVSPDAPAVQGDSRRIAQILFELLDNAVKFTPAGGTIGVRITPKDGYAILQIWDTGEGMSPAELSQIWHAFTHFEKEGAERHGGLGLGLTIVKRLVEMHGGQIEVTSEQGVGTTFTVTLPIGSPVEAA